MKIFISAGEASGDLHISYIVKAIKNSIKDKNENIEFYGMAGEHSLSEGVEIIQDTRDISIMGFTGIYKKYRFLKAKAYEYLEFIKKNNIDKIILVDYGGFNLKFLKLLKEAKIKAKVYYYIPPKLWAWGESRIKTLKLADHILVIFPWEVEFYKKKDVKVIYYGNPFSEIYSSILDRGECILLLAGSRKQEINSSIPVFNELIKSNRNESFILKLSNKKDLELLDKDFLKHENLNIIYDIDLKEVVKKSRLAVATAGTVTLELALLGIPTIVVYRTNFINYLIAKYILKIKFISLPNLTLNREILPELIQKDFTVKGIAKKIKYMDENKKNVEASLLEVRKALSMPFFDSNDLKLANTTSSLNIIQNYANFIINGE